MNLQTDTTEEALLELLDKSEEEQAQLFIDNGVLKPNDIKCSECDSLNWLGYESLADCAERLWEKAIQKAGRELVSVLLEYLDVFDKPCKNKFHAGWRDWMLFYSKPIHRIIAALIALKRSGVENV